MNIGYIGIVLNTKSVEILKAKYSLGDITNFKVVELDQSKKRYVLDLSTVLSDDEDKENSMKFTKKLNVCEKSFYPQSYLKMVNDHNFLEEEKEKDNLKNPRKEISIYDLHNSNNNTSSNNIIITDQQTLSHQSLK